MREALIMQDSWGRNIDYLRISVTDRCSLRCCYCMPPEGVPLTCHEDILRFEEIARIVTVLARMGLKTVRLTGGEPLVRRDIGRLAAALKAVPGIETVALTTNGLRLGELAADLVKAGLDEVNVSLDTLDPETFRIITGSDGLDQVLESIRVCRRAGLPVRLNCVPVSCGSGRDRDLADIAAIARDQDIAVRFIEMMPIGPGADLASYRQDQLMDLLQRRFGPARPSASHPGKGPAVYYEFAGFKSLVGFISPLSHCFCDSCSRIRLSAAGVLQPCLAYEDGVDLKSCLLEGGGRALEQALEKALSAKPRRHDFQDRGAAGRPADRRSMSGIGG